MDENFPSILASASFIQVRIGRNGWLAGTKSSSLTVENKLSLYPSVPRIAVPDLFDIAIVGRMSRFFNSLLMLHLFNANGRPTVQASEERIPASSDYFEEMIAVAFNSFGAIEAFCNQTVVEKGGNAVWVLVKKTMKVSKTPEDVKREHSTDEKVGRIVPVLLSIRTPRGWRAGIRIWVFSKSAMRRHTSNAGTRCGMPVSRASRRSPYTVPNRLFQATRGRYEGPSALSAREY